MNTIEYKVIRIAHNNSFVDFSPVLNAEAKEGWTVVSITDNSVRHNYVVVLSKSVEKHITAIKKPNKIK